MRPTVQEDLHRIRTGEDGQPLDHGAGQEMGFVRLQDQVAASGHTLALSTGTLERGNDQKEKMSKSCNLFLYSQSSVLAISL